MCSKYRHAGTAYAQHAMADAHLASRSESAAVSQERCLLLRHRAWKLAVWAYKGKRERGGEAANEQSWQ